MGVGTVRIRSVVAVSVGPIGVVRTIGVCIVRTIGICVIGAISVGIVGPRGVGVSPIAPVSAPVDVIDVDQYSACSP